MISKPAGPLRELYPLSKLRNVYDWSDDRFNALRGAINSFHKEHDGPASSIQNTEKREIFELQVVKKFPELKKFEGYWPAYVLLMHHRKRLLGGLGKRRRKKKVQTARHHSKQSSSAFVGKPLPLRMRIQKKRMVTTAARRPLVKSFKKVSTQPEVSVRPSSPSTVAQPGLSLRPSRVPPLRAGIDGPITCPPEARILTGNISREQQAIDIDIGCVCLFCHSTPDVPTGAKTHIQVFSQQKGIINALSRLGIVNDKHLYILKQLAAWNAGPKEFIESLGTDVLSPLYNLSLLQHFQKYYSSNAPASLYRDINRRSGCPDHSQGNNDRTPPKLQRLLDALSMEELAPLFIAAYVETDDDFDVLHDLDKSQRVILFEGDQFQHIRPLQRWMLNFLLAHIDMLDG